MQQYRSMRSTRFNRSHTRSFVPSATQQISVYDATGATTTSIKPVYGWFDVASPVNMTNLWFYSDPLDSDTPTDDLNYDLEITAHIAFKNVR